MKKEKNIIEKTFSLNIVFYFCKDNFFIVLY